MFCFINNNGREAVKCAQTDLNQAEDLSPLGSSCLPDPQLQNQLSGEEKRKL